MIGETFVVHLHAITRRFVRTTSRRRRRVGSGAPSTRRRVLVSRHKLAFALGLLPRRTVPCASVRLIGSVSTGTETRLSKPAPTVC